VGRSKYECYLIYNLRHVCIICQIYFLAAGDEGPEGSSAVERIMDEDLKSSVIDLRGLTVASTFVQCPKKNLGPLKSLGITLPHLVLLIKNMGGPCSIEVHVMDSKNERRRFRASTFQRSVKTNAKITAMPLKLSDGWNHIQFNLDEFLYKWYSSRYKETVQIQVHASCRIRRIYFTEKLVSEEDLPPEFRLYVCSPQNT